MFRLVAAAIIVFIGLFSTSHATTVLITGANRGIGYEFARIYAERGWGVIATYRRQQVPDSLVRLAENHDKVRNERMDVTDHSMIEDLAEVLSGTAIDIIINNAGISGGGSRTQRFGNLDYGPFRSVMETNVSGPLKITEAFLDHVKASEQKKIITVTSSQGSIGSVNRPGLYYYRSSKSAVNMIMANIAKQLKAQGVIIGLVAPGATDTDFMAEVRGRIPLGDAGERTAAMIKIIDNMTMDQAGIPIEYDNTVIPW